MLAALLTLAPAAACAEVAPPPDLVLRVAVRPEIEPELEPELEVTLTLVNRGGTVAYVPPAIGQMCRSFGIWAQRRGAERPTLLHHKVRFEPGVTLDGLFMLQPHRTLTLEKELSYADVLVPGDYDLWAELDCRGMDEGAAQAFSGLLRSNKAHFTLLSRTK